MIPTVDAIFDDSRFNAGQARLQAIPVDFRDDKVEVISPTIPLFVGLESPGFQRKKKRLSDVAFSARRNIICDSTLWWVRAIRGPFTSSSGSANPSVSAWTRSIRCSRIISLAR
jgi:hypothetical protein